VFCQWDTYGFENKLKCCEVRNVDCGGGGDDDDDDDNNNNNNNNTGQ
jgi:hypothetical protein